MKVRCINNTGEFLRAYEYKPLEKKMMGRFGSTGFSEYGELDIGKDYIVMGIIIFQNYQAYLIDDGNFVSACPCQLFEIIDYEVGYNWHFRVIEKDETIYPFIQSIFGYSELCFDKKSYENLIIEKEKEAINIYYRRKIELENLKSPDLSTISSQKR